MENFDLEQEDIFEIILSKVKAGRKDSAFTKAELVFKDELKNHYVSYAGSSASKVGYAEFIWRLLMDSVEKNREQALAYDQLWEIKRKAVASAVINSTQKYDDIVIARDKEIQFLKQQLSNLAVKYGRVHPETKLPVENHKACQNCGATAGCYCN
ncbi:hypothetical protein [Citrobacter portucalensis]|uniref:hypothetical protein n=1 Tax=Citrobacter portucalensis TaxID=1639133 RepID=UPI003CED1298